MQQDFWLVKDRNELIDLWRAKPAEIARKHGYYDLTTEPRRRELMEKLNETWRDYLGMRRAFPSYMLIKMLIKAGPTGTALTSIFEAAFNQGAIQQDMLPANEGDALRRKVASTFPNTFENLRGAAQHEDVAKILSYSPASGRRRFGEVEAIGPRGHVH